MDWSSEKYPSSSLWLGFVLVFIWGAVSLANAYDRSLVKINDSYSQALKVVGRLDAIRDALARLNIDEEAFLSTGDERFQDGVIESVESLTIGMGMLNSMAASNELERALLTRLFRSIEQVLGSVAESDNVRDTRGRAAAVAFFESKQATISLAKWHADQLRIESTACVSERIRSGRSAALFRAILYGASVGPARFVSTQPIHPTRQSRRGRW